MRIGSWIGLGVAVSGLVSTGCRSKADPVPPPTGPLQYDADDEGAAGREPRATTAGARARKGPKDCTARGTPWDGKHEGCLYEVAGCCYPDAASACAAAGCEGAGCQILEFSPAQVTCRAR